MFKGYTIEPQQFIWIDDVCKLVGRLLAIAGEEEVYIFFYNEKVDII